MNLFLASFAVAFPILFVIMFRLSRGALKDYDGAHLVIAFLTVGAITFFITLTCSGFIWGVYTILHL